MKRWIMMLAVGVAACAGQVAADPVGFDGMTFFPDGTLTFSGDDAVLTNMHGFYEWQGASPSTALVDVSQPLRLNGWKPTPEWLNFFPTSTVFPANTQYSYQGLWHVPAAADYSFAGNFDDGYYLSIDGQVLLNANNYSRTVASNVYLTAGWHTLDVRGANKGGNGGKVGAAWPSGVIFSADNLDFTNDENLPLGKMFGADNDVVAVIGGVAPIFGRMLMNANGAIATAQVPGVPVFSGIVQGSGTLSFPDLGDDPLLFGSPDSLWPAVLDGNIASALSLTNHVWLRQPFDPLTTTIDPDATLAFDGIACPDAAGGSLALNAYSMRMLESTTPAVTSVAVGAGKTLSFTSRKFVSDTFVDAATTFAAAVTLNGGALVFDAAEPMTFNGTFTGTGAIAKDGAGSLTLAGAGSGAGCATTFTVNAGNLQLDTAAALCDAPLHLLGVTGRLVNLNTLTLTSPVTVSAGGFETPAGTVMGIDSTVTGLGGVSKWGEGTLRLDGATDNTNFTLHVRGGTVELNKSSGYALRNIGDIATGATVTLTGTGGNQIADDGRVQMSGGTLDLNGISETIGSITNTLMGSAVVNNGQDAPATLTVGFGNANSDYKDGPIRDGSSQLALTKVGTGTMTIAPEAFKFTGATTVNGGTLRLLPDSYIQASLFRVTFSKVRPDGAYAGSGVQIGEFQLAHEGVGLDWPIGTTATGPATNSGQGPDKAVDNAIGNKWYVNSNTVSLPVMLVIACENPITFNGYRIGTGGDAPGRDPISWTFEVGIPDGTTTNWTEIDSQDDYPMTITRNAYTPLFPIKTMAQENNLFWAGMPVIVNAGGTLLLPGFGSQAIPTLTGAGVLSLDDNSTIILPNPENFEGALDGNGTVILDGTASEVAIQPLGRGITLVNDGSPVTLLSNYDGERTWGANIHDSAGIIGIKQTTGTTYYAAADSTYTGDTLLIGGEAVVAGCAVANHIRFTPLATKSGATTPYQLSRFKLMTAGQEIAYPAGTTANGERTNGNKPSEVPANLLLDDNSKYYSDQGALNPIIIELPFSVAFDGYTWYTANDASSRDPVTWTVEVSLDGITWTLVDRRDNEPITAPYNTKAGEWTLLYMDASEFCAFSPNSKMTIGPDAKLSILNATEPVGPLTGTGPIALSAGTLVLHTGADATFDGTITGTGTVIKRGAATQTLTGTLAYTGDLIIEDGTLDLSAATLTGVTNIILRGGTLTGNATVGNALTVTCEGGAYNAQLDIAGALTITGNLLLTAPEIPYSKTLFTYQSANTDTVTALTSAQMSPPLSAGIRVTVRTDNNSAVLSVSRGGTIIMLQ